MKNTRENNGTQTRPWPCAASTKSSTGIGLPSCVYFFKAYKNKFLCSVGGLLSLIFQHIHTQKRIPGKSLLKPFAARGNLLQTYILFMHKFFRFSSLKIIKCLEYLGKTIYSLVTLLKWTFAWLWFDAKPQTNKAEFI